MSEQRHDTVGCIHAAHQAADIQLCPSIRYRTVCGDPFQLGQNLVFNLGCRKADANVDGALIRDCVLSHSTGNFAAVDKAATGKVVIGLQSYNFVCSFQNGGASFFGRDAGMCSDAMYGDCDRSAAFATDNKAVVHVAGFKIKCS